MGIREFVAAKSEVFDESYTRNKYRDSAFKAGEIAVENAEAADEVEAYDEILNGRWAYVQTPVVRLADGQRVAVRSASVNRCEKGGEFSLEGFDLMVELEQGVLEQYARASILEVVSIFPMLEKEFMFIEYADVSAHRQGYDEALDRETVAAFEAVATAMEKLPLEAEALQ